MKHVLQGANITAPGLISAGGRLPDFPLKVGDIVSIIGEGKEHAMAVGRMLMSSDDMYH